MLSQSLRHPGLKAFHFEAFFTGEAAEPYPFAEDRLVR
jgi:hypothetical protein